MRRLFLHSLLLSLATMMSPPLVDAEEKYVRSLMEARTERVVLQQFDLSCGAAALATVLRYQHGQNVTERELALALIGRQEYIDRPELVRLRQGFSLLDLQRVTRTFGFEGTGLGNLTLADLDQRAPIIVPIDVVGYPHFVVYVGSLGDRVLLADPAYGNRTMRKPDFEDAWITFAQIGQVGFTVERRDGLIPPNQLVAQPADFKVLN